jgi:5,10-methylene-tetrahydrofolate dehydrogenase/methenyl tetrahydrofolate cyclohydrolase
MAFTESAVISRSETVGRPAAIFMGAESGHGGHHRGARGQAV